MASILYVATTQGIYKTADLVNFDLLNADQVHATASGVTPGPPAYNFVIGKDDLLYYVKTFSANGRVFSMDEAGTLVNLSNGYPASAGVKKLLYDAANDRVYGGFGAAAQTPAYWDGTIWTELADKATLTAGSYDALPMLAQLADGTLFTASTTTSTQAQIYRRTGATWTLDLQVDSLITLDASGAYLQNLVVFNDELYVLVRDNLVSVNNCILKRSAAGSWSVLTPPAGLALPVNLTGACVFQGALFVSYWQGVSPWRQEIWRYDGVAWTLDFDVLADNPSNGFLGILDIYAWGDQLLAGAEPQATDDYFLRRVAAGDWDHVVLNGGGYFFAGIAEASFSISPDTGDVTGGTLVTVTSTGFVSSGSYAVTFGTADPVLATFVSATTLTVLTPPHAAGLVDVTLLRVQEDVTDTLTGAYTYTGALPFIISIVPDEGPIAGGTAVTINGGNFITGCSILFDGLPATSVVFVDSTKYTCVTPMHAAGPVDVLIVEP